MDFLDSHGRKACVQSKCDMGSEPKGWIFREVEDEEGQGLFL